MSDETENWVQTECDRVIEARHRVDYLQSEAGIAETAEIVFRIFKDIIRVEALELLAAYMAHDRVVVEFGEMRASTAEAEIALAKMAGIPTGLAAIHKAVKNNPNAVEMIDQQLEEKGFGPSAMSAVMEACSGLSERFTSKKYFERTYLESVGYEVSDNPKSCKAVLIHNAWKVMTGEGISMRAASSRIAQFLVEIDHIPEERQTAEANSIYQTIQKEEQRLR